MDQRRAERLSSRAMSNRARNGLLLCGVAFVVASAVLYSSASSFEPDAASLDATTRGTRFPLAELEKKRLAKKNPSPSPPLPSPPSLPPSSPPVPPPSPPPIKGRRPAAQTVPKSTASEVVTSPGGKPPTFCSRNPPGKAQGFTCMEHKCYTGVDGQRKGLTCATAAGIDDPWGTGFFKCMCTCCASDCKIKGGCNSTMESGVLPNFSLGWPYRAL